MSQQPNYYGPDGPGGQRGGPRRSGAVQKPGCLIAVALVLLVGGCSGLVALTSSNTSPPGGQTAGPTTTTPISVPARPVGQPRWQGTARITSSPFALDVQPPATHTAGYGLTFESSSGTWHAPYASVVGLWDDPTTPDYAHCLAATQQNALSDDERQAIPYKPGEGLCISDTTGQTPTLAFVRGRGPAAGAAVRADVIAWELRRQ